MTTVEITGLKELNAKLAQYVKLSKQSAFDACEKKANDLRINLFRRFYDIRLKDQGFKMPKEGRGVIVRQKTLGSKYESDAPKVSKTGRKLNWYQQAVWQEIARRQMGSGLLGISFLFRRWNKNKTGLVENKSRALGALAQVESNIHNDQTGLSASITLRGMAPGMRKVSDRHGVVTGAMQDVKQDMQVYINRKMLQAAIKSGLKK